MIQVQPLALYFHPKTNRSNNYETVSAQQVCLWIKGAGIVTSSLAESPFILLFRDFSLIRMKSWIFYKMKASYTPMFQLVRVRMKFCREPFCYRIVARL